MFGKKPSKNVAKDRLKLVLIHDRANCSSEILDMIKNDIIKLISNYMEVDEEGIEIEIRNIRSDRNNTQVPALYANIPIKSVRGMVSKYR